LDYFADDNLLKDMSNKLTKYFSKNKKPGEKLYRNSGFKFG